jgi:hypothetical protein
MRSREQMPLAWATCMIDGKQYIVIGTSNGKNRTGPQGTVFVSFALP